MDPWMEAVIESLSEMVTSSILDTSRSYQFLMKSLNIWPWNWSSDYIWGGEFIGSNFQAEFWDFGEGSYLSVV